MPDEALFGWSQPKPTESDEEREVRAAIEAIEADKPFTKGQLALKQMCLSLARNIAAGNSKGRAVANEVATLVSTMQLLEGVEETTGADSLPPETRKLLDGLATPPRLDTPTASYPA